MQITVTIKQECCDPKSDLRPTTAYDGLLFCIHCGQLWKMTRKYNGVDFDDTPKRVVLSPAREEDSQGKEHE